MPDFFLWDETAKVLSLPPILSSAEVKNEWSYTSSPSVFLHCVDRDNLIYSLKDPAWYQLSKIHTHMNIFPFIPL
jgi:hypothetical protein